MRKTVTKFETMHPNCAGIDIGAQLIYVSIDGKEVVSFETFTEGFLSCAKYLQKHHIVQVAMEATGIYWTALYAILEDHQVKVSLVNPKETKQIKGRKTDVRDCQWIQKLFAAGILSESFIPEGLLYEIRMLVRERLDTIEISTTYINKMIRSMELMNIKLKEVISQVHGASGIRIIKAIIDGERDPGVLLSLCDQRIINKKQAQMLKALEGRYTDTYLFMLKANYQMWAQHQLHLQKIDKQTEQILDQFNEGKKEVYSETPAKPIRHHKPDIEDLHKKMLLAFGVNLSAIAGLSDYTLLRLIGETGVDMSRFPTPKHFVSWCGLAPKHHQSGKINKKVKAPKCNNAGQIFKECAYGLLNSKYVAVGEFMRGIKSRRDSPVAIKAGARKLAIAYYQSLTKGIEFVEQGAKRYMENKQKREIALIHKLAKKHNLQLSEKQLAA